MLCMFRVSSTMGGIKFRCSHLFPGSFSFMDFLECFQDISVFFQSQPTLWLTLGEKYIPCHSNYVHLSSACGFLPIVGLTDDGEILNSTAPLVLLVHSLCKGNLQPPFCLLVVNAAWSVRVKEGVAELWSCFSAWFLYWLIVFKFLLAFHATPTNILHR